MKAEPGKVYALIQEGKAHQIFTIATLAEWHDALQIIDVTAVDPLPKEGAAWLGGTTFGPNPVVGMTPEERRRADRDALLLHLTDMEGDALLPAKVRTFATKLKKVL